MKHFGILVMGLALMNTEAWAATVSIPAFDAGHYSWAGDHDPENTNYLVGAVGGVLYAGFLAFDVSGLYSSRTRSFSTTVSQSERLVRRPSLDRAYDPLLPLTMAPFAYSRVTIEVTTRTEQVDLTDYFNFSSRGINFGEATVSEGLLGIIGPTYIKLRDVETPPSEVLAGGMGRLDILSELIVTDPYDNDYYESVSAERLEQRVVFGEEILIVGLEPVYLDLGYLFGGSGADLSKVSLELGGERTSEASFSRTIDTQEVELTSELVYLFDAGLGVSIPEPSSVLLILLGSMMLFTRHSRDRS